MLPSSSNRQGRTLGRLAKNFWARSLTFTKAVTSPGDQKTSRSATADYTRFFAAAECTLDDFYILDGIYDSSGHIVDFRFSYINPNAERRLGVSRESFYGKVLTEVRPFMVKSGLIHEYRKVVRTGIPYTSEVFIDDEMIRGTWLSIQVVRLGNGIAITSRDVTEHRRRSDHINHLAHHDHLTGLANRTLFEECLRKAILRGKNHDQRVAVFLLDIDFFKQINDSLGHAVGDILLATMGQRLLSSVRESDCVARMGGDEFVIVMPNFHTVRDVERCGEQIIRNASQPVEISGRKISLTLSIGVSTFPENGRTAEELLGNADTAMYAVKDSGRNRICVFNDSLTIHDRRYSLNGSHAACTVQTIEKFPIDPSRTVYVGRGQITGMAISGQCTH